MQITKQEFILRITNAKELKRAELLQRENHWKHLETIQYIY